MDHTNAIQQLKLWAKDDIVPVHLQDLCKVAANGLTALFAELETYRWIPVSERPEKTGFYQVLREGNNFPVVSEYSLALGRWTYTILDERDVVTHWKPIILPE